MGCCAGDSRGSPQESYAFEWNAEAVIYLFRKAASVFVAIQSLVLKSEEDRGMIYHLLAQFRYLIAFLFD